MVVFSCFRGRRHAPLTPHVRGHDSPSPCPDAGAGPSPCPVSDNLDKARTVLQSNNIPTNPVKQYTNKSSQIIII